MKKLLLVIMRACLETQKLEQLEARMDEIADRVARDRTSTSMGIIINFTARTVAGLDFPLKITSSDETMVFFEGSNDTERTFRRISGRIDRVTGDMMATSIKMNKNTFISLDVAYFLKCKPTQRMF